MKITIEPSAPQVFEKYPDATVIVEVPRDDATVSEAMELLVKALQAWGYHNENIANHLSQSFCGRIGLMGEMKHRRTTDDETSEYGGV
jgi:hypothetical protein